MIGVERPYKRTVRPPVPEGYVNPDYIRDRRFAKDPDKYVRAFLLLQKDLQNLFDYIEPADDNLTTYSFRIQEILFRACVEVEANFKAILDENGYTNSNNMNRYDYEKVNASHRLSSYKVRIPYWHGSRSVVQPFEEWANNASAALPWYSAYNETKHNRHENFPLANFEYAIEAVCGLLVLIPAQFSGNEFASPYAFVTTPIDNTDEFSAAIGSYFLIRYPDDWPDEEKYAFHWESLKSDPDPFQNFPYPPPPQKKRGKSRSP